MPRSPSRTAIGTRLTCSPLCSPVRSTLRHTTVLVSQNVEVHIARMVHKRFAASGTLESVCHLELSQKISPMNAPPTQPAAVPTLLTPPLVPLGTTCHSGILICTICRCCPCVLAAQPFDIDKGSNLHYRSFCSHLACGDEGWVSSGKNAQL